MSLGSADIARTLKALQENLIVRDQPTDTFDIWKYIRSLKIINKQGQLVNLLLNEGQEEILDKIVTAEKEGRPPRFIIEKSRRVGVSTLINAYIFSKTHHLPYHYSTIVAHDVETAIYLFGMSKIFLAHIPDPKPTRYETKRDITFAPPHYSSLRVGTAGNQKLFSSMLIHYCLFSEFAKWDKPSDPYVAASQCVPPIPDSLMAIESTAFGAQNMFHIMWEESCRGENDFEPVFLEWRNHKEYFMPLAPKEKLVLSPEEAKYQRDYDLTDEQLKWVIWTKANQCRNDWDEFNQEYPITADVAFKSTGTAYFNKDILQSRRMDLVNSRGRVRIPPTRGNLIVEPQVEVEADPEGFIEQSKPVFSSSPAIITLEEDNIGFTEIWEMPTAKSQYVIGADVSEGVRQDYSVAQVIKLPSKLGQTPIQVAKFRSCVHNATDFGVELFMLGLLYNEALICVERNGPGMTALAVLEHGLPRNWRGGDYAWTDGGYPLIYYEQSINERTPRQSGRMGFFTTSSTKPWLLQQLKSAIADDALTLHSVNTIDECMGFVQDAEKRKYEQTRQDPVTKKYTDDEVMSLALAVAMVNYTYNTLFFRDVKSSDF